MRKAAFLFLSTLSLSGLGAAEDAALDAAIQKAVIEYGQRLQTATRELTVVRERIANERAPLVKAIGDAENQIIQLETRVAALEVAKARTEEKSQQARGELDVLNRNLTYLGSLGLDGVKGFDANLLPGENELYAEQTTALRRRLETSTHPDDAYAALDMADLFLVRLQRQLGGYAAPGKSLIGGDNRIIEGTFAFLGPEVVFKAREGSAAGTVRQREASEHVVTYLLPDWSAERSGALFQGGRGSMLADVTGGKALRLRETKGGLWETIGKAGVVGYVLVSLGGLSLLITILKLVDIQHLRVDEPPAVRKVTDALTRNSRGEAEAALRSLKQTTRELFAVGFSHLDSPRTILEEHLEGFVLRQRLHHERRLPLLAVIATAGPLLGLLGTVTGMIKTFTLITVFGTGSAGKLSGGISEALVATELGLIVAIPTLVIHGFLAHRIHKGLASLERYALEFVTATGEARTEERGEKLPVV